MEELTLFLGRYYKKKNMQEDNRDMIFESFRKSVEEVGFNLKSIETVFDLFTKGDVRQLKCDYSIPFGKHKLECLLEFKAETIAHIPFFKGYQAKLNMNPGIDDERSMLAEEFYFKVTETFQDVNVNEAYNLLCGRSVLKFEPVSPDSYVGNWVSLVYGQESQTLTLAQHPRFDFKKLLNSLPVKELDRDYTAVPFINSLLRGNITAATLVNGKDSEPGFISVDAAKGVAVFYNNQREIMPFADLWQKKDVKELKRKSPTAGGVKTDSNGHRRRKH